MKIFAAALSTETNTFAAAPTGRAGFEAFGIHRGDGSLVAPDGEAATLAHLRRLCQADGHDFVESVCAFAQPSGPTLRAVYEEFRDQILDDLRAAMPVDVALLCLHGAMVAEGCDDCEGDLLAQVRTLVGPGVAVGAELDLHCHFTERMRGAADVLVAYKEYPHTDVLPRASELYRLLLATARREVRPVTAVFDCRMVGLWHTTREPMAGFVRRMQSFEGHDGVLSVSLGHGFPWGDVPEAGAKLWVVTDGDEGRARALAGQLGREFWALREQTMTPALSIDAALDQTIAAPPGLVVLADVADNAGGGAPSDSTFILRRLIDRGFGRAALGPFWDVGAVQICIEAGVGAVLDLRVGGKVGPVSGEPVDLRVTVRAIREGHDQDVFGMRWPMGTAVWVEAANDVHLLLCTVRSQLYGTDAFTGIGITLDDKRLVVVKSTQHFHAAFAPLACAVLYVATPGAIDPDFARIPYRRRSLRYWPREVDPHGDGAAGGGA